MRRKYNYKVYGTFKKVGKVAREKISPDYGKIFSSVFGVLGKVLATVFVRIIAKPVQWLTFSSVSKFYDKKKDSPFLGSAMYTVLYVVILFIIAGILKGILN